ncbi:MAG: SIR2 family NAD-dependent protein deacylase [Lysobacter sp.]
MTRQTSLKAALALVRSCRRPVAFTGAGISAESGIPTFRGGSDSLWSKWKPEQLATPQAFQADRELVWGWYASRMAQLATVQPHDGHRVLASFEERWPGFTIVTQNVDDLHERAGSTRVLHLHGELLKLRCFSCHRPGADFVAPPEPALGPEQRLSPPLCEHCGSPIRPGVVWFGESLPQRIWQQAQASIEGCDLLLVVGTSGQVEPAASLVALARQSGARVLLIDPGTSEHEGLADVHLRGSAGAELQNLHLAF